MGVGASSGSGSGNQAYLKNNLTTNVETYGKNLSSVIEPNLAETSAWDGPPKPFLTDLVEYNPSVPGFGSVLAGTQVNPFTDQYETNTQELYENRLDKQLARVQSGPEAVMAPLARGKSFRESETLNEFARGRNKEIRDERNVDNDIMIKNVENMIGQRINAASIFPALKTADQASFMTAASLLGPKQQQVVDIGSGIGDSSNTGYSFGGGVNLCCFIFLESMNGKLPWFVRVCRDFYATPQRIKGYRKMSKWLVPAMKTWKPVRFLVNALMVTPMMKFGGWLCREEGFESYEKLRPVTKFWFAVWDFLGKERGL